MLYKHLSGHSDGISFTPDVLGVLFFLVFFVGVVRAGEASFGREDEPASLVGAAAAGAS